MRDTTTRPTPDEFRSVLRSLTTPVAVVTTRDGARIWGMTVSAFSSLCLDPPSFVLCVNDATATASHLRRDAQLGLNVLTVDQSEISRRCSAPGEPKHIDPELLAPSPDGSPSLLLGDTVASFECDATLLDAAGSHLLIVATVRSVRSSNAPPLLYGAGGYRRDVPVASAVIQ